LARVDGLSQAAQTLPEDQSRRLVDEVTAVLRSRSIGGNIVGQVDADVFGFIEAGAPNAAELADELKNAVKNAGVAANLINPIIAMMSLAAEGLTEVDIRRAIAHAVKMTLGTDTMRKGRTSLKEQFAEACKATLVAVTKLRGQIDRREIVLVYQPIVDLAKRQPHHYEALARRLDGTTATEIITFGEEIGLIAEIDLMILRMALKQLGSGPGPAVAVNISGQSVQLEGFRTEMLALIGEGGVDSSRLMFELTESSTVDKVEEVAAYLKSLRGRGHAVCLDDFGAGAAAYGYLRNFEVDFVKLDGPFLRAAGENQRDRALVASVVKLCEELKCRTIGEMIETEADARAAAELGIGYGQGWLYGKPLSDLPAVPGQSARASKRIGARDSWG
jgi:EAL domain-containing protein (putative c-di-GMP-specific phosphodiesterase class I)